MTVEDRIAAAPLENLGYFAEWGGAAWERLLSEALRNRVGITRFENARVLDVGTRYGKMAVLFALLGATVTAIDLREHLLRRARAEAEKFGVADRIVFETYDGDLDTYADGTFDLVFTKSVLVAVPDLPAFLEKANRKLAPGGHALFLENGRGGLVAQLLRRIRHKRWDWRTARYFTDPDMAVFRQAFDVQAVEKCRFPPVYLVHGTKRTAPDA